MASRKAKSNAVIFIIALFSVFLSEVYYTKPNIEPFALNNSHSHYVLAIDGNRIIKDHLLIVCSLYLSYDVAVDLVAFE